MLSLIMRQKKVENKVTKTKEMTTIMHNKIDEKTNARNYFFITFTLGR